jgi:dipeptidyl aminopeptidase/acylaminoacyl peptidase
MTTTERGSSAFTVDDFVQVDVATEPSFSHDGQSIVFLSNRSSVAQPYVVSLEGEQAAPAGRLVETEGIVYGTAVRPGRPEVLYVTDDGGDEQWQLNLVGLDGANAKALGSEPRVIYNFGAWSADGRYISYVCNRRDVRFSDVYVLDVETGVETCVLQQDVPNVRAGGFSPDARTVIVTWPNMALPGDSNLYLVDVDNPGSLRCITEHAGAAQWPLPATAQRGPVAQFVDMNVILSLSDEDREFIGLQRIDLESGRREYLLEPEWDVETMAVSRDCRRIAVSINEDGYSRLQALELNEDCRLGPELSLGELPSGVISSVAWSPDGASLAFAFESAQRPSDIWLLDLGWETPRQVTFSNLRGLTLDDLPEPELVRYTSFDGREIPAFFYRPARPASSQPLPAMVLVHGGPESQSRPALWGRYAAPAYLLARGEACLLVPNVRGSTGYGKEYTHADDVEKRMDSVRDLFAAVDWLTASGQVDPARISVMGGSYGGFMTLAAITEAPELWAAAVDMFGIANWETFMENTGPWRRAQRAREYGSDPAFLRTISPIHKADRIRAPLMVIQGDHDVRVPPEESEQIADTVRRNEGIVQYEVFEREGHGIQRLPNRLRMNRLIVDFLREHLLDRKE